MKNLPLTPLLKFNTILPREGRKGLSRRNQASRFDKFSDFGIPPLKIRVHSLSLKPGGGVWPLEIDAPFLAGRGMELFILTSTYSSRKKSRLQSEF
jgi:hypothetical protein